MKKRQLIGVFCDLNDILSSRYCTSAAACMAVADAYRSVMETEDVSQYVRDAACVLLREIDTIMAGIDRHYEDAADMAAIAANFLQEAGDET